MDRKSNISGEECPVARAIAAIVGKWRLLIRFTLADAPLRFGELTRAVEGISQKILSAELRAMVQLGQVERRAYPEVPPRVEYALTANGKDALGIVEQLRALGEKL